MWLDRTKLLVKQKGVEALQNSNILVVGLGGVGGFACEFLARAGIGNMTIVDGDKVDVTNKNRQIIALESTIGQRKAKVLANRLLDINPKLNIRVIDEFLNPERAFDLVDDEFCWVADCIDSITPKINLMKACRQKGVRLISSMGAGGVLDATKVEVTDINKTKNCPLARNIRRRLKNEGGAFKFKAVYSTELIREDALELTDGKGFKKSYYGTISYMPAAFGLVLSSYIIRDIISKMEN